jgi:hypothetical protein
LLCPDTKPLDFCYVLFRSLIVRFNLYWWGPSLQYSKNTQGICR